MTKKLREKISYENKNLLLIIRKLCILRLLEGLGPPNEYQALKNMAFLYFFPFLWVTFACMDPVPDSQSGSGKIGNTILFKTQFEQEIHTANEGPVRIQYKCQVPIYVLRYQYYHVLSPNSTIHIHVSVSRLYIPQDRTGYFAAA